MERGAFLNADVSALGVSAKGREQGEVGVEAERIVAPLARRDHPAIEVDDTVKFLSVESGGLAPVPGTRERRDDVQALFAFGRGVPDPTWFFRSALSKAISRSNSHSRASTGSAISLHGVP